MYDSEGRAYKANPQSCSQCDGNQLKCPNYISGLEIAVEVHEVKKQIIIKGKQ